MLRITLIHKYLVLTLSSEPSGDSGTGTVNTSQSLTITVQNEIETSLSGQSVTIGLPNTVNVTTAIDVPTIEVTNVKA